MRKKLDTKKIGHTGTLDPFATGLLLVAVGKYTKLIPFLDKEHKTYRTKIVFGKNSPTLDPESEIKNVEIPQKISRKLLEKIMTENFSGTLEQIPPQFSAIKINGEKSYNLARKGETVELKPRQTAILNWKIHKFNDEENVLDLEICVKAGFYVRALARDLGEKCKTKAICQELRRTKIGELRLEDSENLEMVNQGIDAKYILKNLEIREIETGRVQDFISGRSFPFSGVNGEKFLVLVGGNSLGVAEIIKGKLQPRIVL